jgi:AcrR family transcriptional regulator
LTTVTTADRATRLTGGTPTAENRRLAIVRAGAGVFLRYGYRKTSMEDVARAADLSRQGLYLHFPTKDELFREVIAYLGGLAVEALGAELARPGGKLEARLMAGFDAMAASALTGHEPAALRELFTAARELVADEVEKVDQQIVAELTTALTRARKAGSGAVAGVSPRALAEHLYVASYGLQHRGHSGDDYRSRMKIAVRIVCAVAGA